MQFKVLRLAAFEVLLVFVLLPEININACFLKFVVMVDPDFTQQSDVYKRFERVPLH